MTWALGIGVHAGKLIGEVLNREGNIDYLSLTAFADLGTPSMRSNVRKGGIITNFSDWKRVDATEYLYAFGVKLPEAALSRHTVFEFTERQTRFVVPALALMRTLFRPNKYLLPNMFQAQSLDRFSFTDHSVTPPVVVLDAPWAQPTQPWMSPHIHDALSWICSAPSAINMAESVHKGAMAGRLDLTLPQGEARLSVHGIKIGNTYFVTDVTLTAITTTEQPYSNEIDHPTLIAFQNLSSSQRRNIEIPVHPDGSVEITGEEWEIVGPTLLAGMALTRVKLNQRYVFDGILNKLATKVDWRKAHYKVGTTTHALNAYRCWSKRGALQKAIAQLFELRAAY